MSPEGADRSALVARRKRVLSPTYRLFYGQPLEIVRALDVWMYDERGRRYLDAYNNVPVVGHCHPQVVAALAAQAGTLNTHTRYLAEQPLQLAEELLATMPAALGNVIFTCTGSEANDLAARIAKSVTGGGGFIITEFAYHGGTELIDLAGPSGGISVNAGVNDTLYLGPNDTMTGGTHSTIELGGLNAGNGALVEDTGTPLSDSVVGFAEGIDQLSFAGETAASEQQVHRSVARHRHVAATGSGAVRVWSRAAWSQLAAAVDRPAPPPRYAWRARGRPSAHPRD